MKFTKRKINWIATAGVLFLGLAVTGGHANPPTPQKGDWRPTLSPDAQSEALRQTFTGNSDWRINRRQETFNGAVTRNPDNGDLRSRTYVLYDEDRNARFFIDNDNTANFEGKEVEISGNLDAATNTIHAESINEIARPRSSALLGK